MPHALHVLDCRWLFDKPAPGAWNMAVDEVLLEDAESGVATLRCYGWSKPTLSLGYFQRTAGRADHPASLVCPLVRRASGGGAILHDAELTYSFAAPIADRLGASAAGLYEAIHGAIVETLARFAVVANAFPGPAEEAASSFLCFQRRAAGDLMVGQSKIVGSAQRRHRQAILQHGSVLLGASRFARSCRGSRNLPVGRCKPRNWPTSSIRSCRAA